jgi:RNA polymerase sigma-70 factor (ECF subfamily)
MTPSSTNASAAAGALPGTLASAASGSAAASRWSRERGAVDHGDSPESDAELVQSSLDGDPAAARELVRRYHRPVFAFVSRMVGQAQDAEDITQDTFVKVFKNLDRVDTDRPLINWLFTIARRTAINHFRDRKDWTILPEETTAAPEQGEPTGEPRRATELREKVEGLWAMARRVLKPREFEVMWLRFAEEQSTEETARQAGLSLGQVKTLVYRARQRLIARKEAWL